MQKRTFQLLMLPLVVVVALGLFACLVFLLEMTGARAGSGSADMVSGQLDRNAFSRPEKNMPASRKMDFLLGRAIFKKLWVSSPSSTKASDGLGPLYNARSCLGCHPRNGRGRPPQKGEQPLSLFLQLSVSPQTDDHKRLLASGKMAFIPAPLYGGQLQSQAVQGLAAEASLKISYEPVPVILAGGEKVVLRKPAYSLSGWGYGNPHRDLQTSPRLAPQMIGLGLLQAIPENEILKNADPQDLNRDGISGKASRVWSFTAGTMALGRFGWKASTPSLLEQSSRALNSDIGISNPVFSAASGDCTARQATCLGAPDGNTKRDGNLELGKPMNDRLAFYTANLAVPPARKVRATGLAGGEALFHAAGCASCHRPSFVTGTVPDRLDSGGAHLSGRTIVPYTDLLLHDMGPGLADGRPVHNATGTEWRTAPLWGIGLSGVVNGNNFFLHDGRARSIKEAILWHGGEAQQARDAFAGLKKDDRERLLAFVKSL